LRRYDFVLTTYSTSFSTLQWHMMYYLDIWARQRDKSTSQTHKRCSYNVIRLATLALFRISHHQIQENER